MNVQKYIKRLKFARADKVRRADAERLGITEGSFRSWADAEKFLNDREFFFGDPFVIRWLEEDHWVLALAIGKGHEPTAEEKESGEVAGDKGPGAYELFELGELREEIERLKETVSANTEAIEEINDAIDALNDLIGDITGSTADLLEITGEGWTDSPDNITLTDRIKRDEQLMKIEWGHVEGQPFDGKVTDVPFDLEYDATHNKLYISVNGDRVREVQLIGLIEDAEYLPDTETIRFWYNHDLGPDSGYVDVPVGGLIDEWDVEDTDTVDLNKDRVESGKDVLTANVKISDDADNMLVAKGDGLYVSSSANTAVENLKADLATLDDGHFPADYFSGSTINGSSNIQEALLKLDQAVADAGDELASAMTQIDERLDESDEVVARALNELAEGVAQNADDIDGLQENLEQETQARIGGDMAAQGRCQMIQDQLDEEKLFRKAIKLVQIDPSDFGEVGLGDDVRDAYFVTYHKPQSTEAYELPQPGDAIIKVYKDSAIYKIYFGHIDDSIAAPDDPTVVPGTGDTAICFIYKATDTGNYSLAAYEFQPGEIIEELEATVDEMQEVVARALNALAEAIDKNAFDIYNLQEGADNLNQALENERNDRIAGDGAIMFRCDQIQNQLTDEKTYRKSIKIRQLTASEVTDKFGPDTNVLEAYKLIDHNGDVSDSDVVKIYKDAVTVADMDSFKLVYEPESQEIRLNWQSGGRDNTTHIDVSDFVKDSFLEGVQVVTRDGIQYLEFRFKTYDGEPIPIYIPLADFATIYSAGDGIDPDELENNQVITVKIDPMHEGEQSFLTKEPNGLRVTGVTEAIEEAVENLMEEVDEKISAVTESLDEYVRKDEVEDHLDSASTLPVQNQVVTNALNDLVEQVEEMLENLTAITADTIITNELTASTTNIENLYADNAEIENLTAHTIYADEYQNLPTATTEQFGVVILDDELSLDSANPVQNSAITQVILENEETVAAALNDLNDRKADKTYVDAADQNLQEQIDGIVSGGLTGVRKVGDGNVVTDIAKDGNDVVATMGVVDTDNITAQTINVDNVTAQTIDVENISANTIYAEEYQNLPTATTEDYGVVIVDDSASTTSENPIQNKVITKIILDNEETTAAALNDLNDRKADKTELENEANERESVDQNLQEQIDNISAGGLTNVRKVGDGNVVTNIEKDGNDVVATMGTVDTDNITAQTIVTNTIEGDEAHFSGLTANTFYAEEYQNLPTATTEDYGVVIVDDEPSTASTNPIQNKVITQIILDNEETVAAALNDLNDRKADKSYVDDAIEGLGDVIENHETRIVNVEEAIETLSAGGITGVTETGQGNVIVSIEKDGLNVKATKGTITADDRVLNTTFNTYTAATQTTLTGKADKSYVDENFVHDVEYYSSGDTHEIRFKDAGNNVIATVNADDFIKDGMVDTVTITGSNLVITFNTDAGKSDISIPLTDIFNPNNYYTKSEIDNMIVVDDEPDTASTNPIQNKVITQIILDDEEATAAALNDLNDKKAEKTEVNNLGDRVTIVEEAIETLAGGGLTGVTVSGSGNAVVNIEKDGLNVKATLGNIDVSNKLDTSVFNTFTGSTLNDVSGNTGSIVTNVEKDGDKVKVTKTNNLSGLDGLTATTISATTYNNLPTGDTSTFGVVKVDDKLDTGYTSTNPVQNKAITKVIIDNERVTSAALNDLNNRKANVEDIPVTIYDLDDSENIAMKSDLAGYLPLSGGTMTGNISGDTGVAVYMPGGFFQESDERLKIFMGEIEGALDKANAIPTKYFYWKNMPDGPRQLGTSAQKVQEVFPEIVSGEDKLSVDYSKLAIVALAAVKELTAKVEDLQNQLNELKK